MHMPKYTKDEIKLFKKLSTPVKIQDFLNTVPNNFDQGNDTLRSPREMLRKNKAHCMEGALFAAAVFEFHKKPALLLDLKSTQKDLDHVVTLFKQNGYWGAISKTNHAVLRYREPVYRTIRELALSYFHEYFLHDGTKTLLSYSQPFNLKKFKREDWQTSAEDLWHIAEALDDSPHIMIVPKQLRKKFRKADLIEINAGKLTEWKRKK